MLTHGVTSKQNEALIVKTVHRIFSLIQSLSKSVVSTMKWNEWKQKQNTCYSADLFFLHFRWMRLWKSRIQTLQRSCLCLQSSFTAPVSSAQTDHVFWCFVFIYKLFNCRCCGPMLTCSAHHVPHVKWQQHTSFFLKIEKFSSVLSHCHAMWCCLAVV